MLKSKKFIYAAVGFCMILAGVFYFLHNSSQKGSTEITYEETDVMCETADISGEPDASDMEESAEAHETASEETETVCVYVCGDVCEPGVYYFQTGSRIADAVMAAGGMKEDADADYVNLAGYLADGQMIYIPVEGENMPSGSGNETLTSSEQGGSLVNINTAGEAELTTLPGIGQSRAEDIISYRENNGSFAKIDDIMKVPGIKEASFDKIKDMICV